jgi:acetyl-CoA acetyltransferase
MRAFETVRADPGEAQNPAALVLRIRLDRYQAVALRSMKPLRSSLLWWRAQPGLPEDIVNVEGGAVAHGHPIGATGAVLTTKLIQSMRRDGLTRGLVTLCIGGGQGIALAVEALR